MIDVRQRWWPPEESIDRSMEVDGVVLNDAVGGVVVGVIAEVCVELQSRAHACTHKRCTHHTAVDDDEDLEEAIGELVTNAISTVHSGASTQERHSNYTAVGEDEVQSERVSGARSHTQDGRTRDNTAE